MPTRRAFLAQVAAAPARPNILLLLADNWAAPVASALGDPVVRTPVFDRLAREGALFLNAFAPTPSCAPSRAALLTGQESHRLEAGANLHGHLPAKYQTYPEALERAGYATGFMLKGWGPGQVQRGGRTRNPAGARSYPGFDRFLDENTGRPFCFWFGSHDPHRPWDRGERQDPEGRAARVRVPAYLPDHADVRADLVDYGYEVEQFDRECGAALDELTRRGLLENTLVVMTSDNGWQFPRGLANVYDAGTRVPMAVWWGGGVAGLARARRGQRREEFVTTTDLASLFLEIAGAPPFAEMTARSPLPLMQGRRQPGRDRVFLERERHANVRRGDLTYPVRAIRTRDWLYVMNLEPERWPAGDPERYFAVGPYGDVDDSRTKRLLLQRRPEHARSFDLGFAKRPAEELYDLRRDPDQTENRAADPQLSKVKAGLRGQVLDWMKATADPRTQGPTDVFDRVPYYGPPAR